MLNYSGTTFNFWAVSFVWPWKRQSSICTLKILRKDLISKLLQTKQPLKAYCFKASPIQFNSVQAYEVWSKLMHSTKQDDFSLKINVVIVGNLHYFKEWWAFNLPGVFSAASGHHHGFCLLNRSALQGSRGPTPVSSWRKGPENAVCVHLQAQFPFHAPEKDQRIILFSF